jgi:endo-1,3-1,4-beta-glycanase ExoK
VAINRSRAVRAVTAAALGAVVALTTGAAPVAAAIGPSFVDNFNGFDTGR